MNGLSASPSYAERLEAFRQSDAERDAMVAAVIKELEELKVQVAEKTDDLSNEIASRRMWQARATQSEQALAQHKQTSNSNNFVLAVIDGDGAPFQDYLYSMGKDGGAEAAQKLYVGLREHLQSIYPDANVSDWNIVVQVVLNLQGLATKLQSCGLISNPNELLAFGRAFGLAQPLFSFVDVGGGKERADHKIRETLRLYLPISQCKHVFFGPCHDNGYLPVLEPYRRDSSMASRLTLIETRPAEGGFIELGLRRMRLPVVFRSENLPAARSVVSPAPLATPVRTPSGIEPTPLVPQFPKAASPAPSTASTHSAANSASWAAIGKNGGAGKNFDIAPRKTPVRRFILLNGYGDRLDEKLPKPDGGAETRFAKRVEANGKYCNNYYLTGRCEAGEYCDYIHGEKLTPGEMLVLKHKSTTRNCPDRSTCRDFDCTFGHHCKFGNNCYFDRCHFEGTHNMDLEPARKLYEDGSEEWIGGYLQKHGK
ncbi:hypothetical protein AC579_6757 [Lecanosticta acicola]|uniref:C3H1-type domain-containing protein n=1 Tax=Lecanosticta acicola TaxID=111012 RepID=A0AAI9EBI5_9PEZI|nr:hypothetical protein AC579_6757 [Lecanosticta acicola]